MKHRVTAGKSGNRAILDAINILHVDANTICKTMDLDLITEDADENINVVYKKHDYFTFYLTLSPYIEDVITYISGFVSKKAGNLII